MIREMIIVMTVDWRIKRIMQRYPEGIEGRSRELKELAKQVGAPLDGTEHQTVPTLVREHEVISRIREAARSHRESLLWIIALTSAIASVLSALAAWCAVLKR